MICSQSSSHVHRLDIFTRHSQQTGCVQHRKFVATRLQEDGSNWQKELLHM